MTGSIALPHQHRSPRGLNGFLIGLACLLLLAVMVWVQRQLDFRQDRALTQIDDLAQLPNGKYLKPSLLGYHHLGADILWLRLVQVIGKKRNSADEYEWMYHALDVITTLDPQYAYAYYAGGVILGDLANRPDLSNRLLLRGIDENPTVWNIPFLLGYNYYFLLGDAAKGAEYIMKAASLPDRPTYLPGLATRLAAEAGTPGSALVFLEARLRETRDPQMQEFLVNRMKEVMIERDIQILEKAVETYHTMYRTAPPTLMALVDSRILPRLPLEPFDGEYHLDTQTGRVSSSTHPERLRTFFKRKQEPAYSFPNIQQPAYTVPKIWE